MPMSAHYAASVAEIDEQRAVTVLATGDETVAHRLTLISRAEWFDLEQPVFVPEGERYWVDREQRSLVVEDSEGHRRSFPVKPSGPDTFR